jgi:lipopolysaccharide export system protein LptA
MPSSRSVRGLALVLSALAGVAGAQSPPATATGTPAAGTQPAATPPSGKGSGGPLGGFGALGKSKEPIHVVSDNLEYDYKRNVVVYRGAVEVVQGNVKMVSDTLTITLQSQDQNQDQNQDGKPPAPRPASAGPGSDTGRVQEIIALGNVRIDQGTRWAVGGRAVYDQSQRTLVLTENPVLHDGPSEVAGDRVVVFLDEDRSVVEGGNKRVKAVFYPDEKNAGPGGQKPGGAKAARKGRQGTP